MARRLISAMMRLVLRVFFRRIADAEHIPAEGGPASSGRAARPARGDLEDRLRPGPASGASAFALRLDGVLSRKTADKCSVIPLAPLSSLRFFPCHPERSEGSAPVASMVFPRWGRLTVKRRIFSPASSVSGADLRRFLLCAMRFGGQVARAVAIAALPRRRPQDDRT